LQQFKIPDHVLFLDGHPLKTSPNPKHVPKLLNDLSALQRKEAKKKNRTHTMEPTIIISWNPSKPYLPTKWTLKSTHVSDFLFKFFSPKTNE
jgi:hypothetical protein